jgi:hypothetical protein
MNTQRIANRLRCGKLINVYRRHDGGLWLDAEHQPRTSYGYPKGRIVEYVGFGGLELSRLP